MWISKLEIAKFRNCEICGPNQRSTNDYKATIPNRSFQPKFPNFAFAAIVRLVFQSKQHYWFLFRTFSKNLTTTTRNTNWHCNTLELSDICRSALTKTKIMKIKLSLQKKQTFITHANGWLRFSYKIIKLQYASNS